MFSFFKVDEEQFFKELFSDDFNAKKVEKYIQRGIDLNKVDENGNTVLFELVNQKKYEAIKTLFDAGIDKNLENKFAKTILDEACEKSNGAMVRFLLENGFDINRKKDNNE